jgi:hypothetical protein
MSNPTVAADLGILAHSVRGLEGSGSVKRAPHQVRKIAVVELTDGDVRLEFVRFDGRVVCGADALVLTREQALFLIDALPTVSHGLAKRAEDITDRKERT